MRGDLEWFSQPKLNKWRAGERIAALGSSHIATMRRRIAPQSSLPLLFLNLKVYNILWMKKRSKFTLNNNKRLQRFSALAYEYLGKGIRISEPLTPLQIKMTFLLVLKDFLENKITLEELGAIATDLYYYFAKTPTDIDAQDSSLGKALGAATEIEWYFHHRKENKENEKWYKHWLQVLKNYYQKNKIFLPKLNLKLKNFQNKFR